MRIGYAAFSLFTGQACSGGSAVVKLRLQGARTVALADRNQCRRRMRRDERRLSCRFD